MKKSLILAVTLMVSTIGLSQTVDATGNQKSNASCEKGKPACCAHAKKSCGDKSKANASADAPATENTPSLKATEPKKTESASVKTGANT